MAKQHTPAVETQRGYNTNLASEFFVLSILYRLGLDASLTLGIRSPSTFRLFSDHVSIAGPRVGNVPTSAAPGRAARASATSPLARIDPTIES